MGARPITVEWMDGRFEVYDSAETSVSNGVLHIHQYTGVTRSLMGEHHIPLSNVREWYPADQDRG